jgi:hypothetical protein
MIDAQNTEELQIEFARRVRKHMMAIPITLACSLVPGIVIVSLAASFHFGKDNPPPTWFITMGIVLFVAGVLGGMGYGFYSAATNLRCPACDGSVWMLISYNNSLLGMANPKTACPRCGATIVGETLHSSSRRFALVAIGVGFMIAMVGAGVGFAAGKRRHAKHNTSSIVDTPSTSDTPNAPGTQGN